MSDEVNAMMTLHTTRDARSISDRLPRPKPPAVNVGGSHCIHIKNAASLLASEREECGQPVEVGKPNGFLCWYHQALVFNPQSLTTLGKKEEVA